MSRKVVFEKSNRRCTAWNDKCFLLQRKKKVSSLPEEPKILKCLLPLYHKVEEKKNCKTGETYFFYNHIRESEYARLDVVLWLKLSMRCTVHKKLCRYWYGVQNSESK
jgi:hypothetical protein